jgi:urea transporter
LRAQQQQRAAVTAAAVSSVLSGYTDAASRARADRRRATEQVMRSLFHYRHAVSSVLLSIELAWCSCVCMAVLLGHVAATCMTMCECHYLQRLSLSRA